jgi:NAD(P)-dependent dehydrogenase (short-subunit alcohol dehydrogenase family)
MIDFDRLEGKSILVTGAADGIGLALAAAFAAEGARLFVTDIAAEKLEKAAAQLGAASAACDVTNARAVADVVDEAWQAIGPIDLLCSNAGVFKPGSVLDASREDIEWQFGVNVWGILNACRPYVRRLREAGREGHILMTGSEHSLSSPAYLREVPIHVYNMTKHCVLSLADGLRNELAAEGVGVSVLCPGPVATNLADNSGAFRPARFGGPTRIELGTVSEELVREVQSLDQPASQTAAIAIAGLRRGLFVIPTHRALKADAVARFREIERGFEVL